MPNPNQHDEFLRRDAHVRAPSFDDHLDQHLVVFKHEQLDSVVEKNNVWRRMVNGTNGPIRNEFFFSAPRSATTPPQDRAMCD